jgi:hypothetical protein
MNVEIGAEAAQFPEKEYIVEDSKTSRNMCEDLLGYSHKQAKY